MIVTSPRLRPRLHAATASPLETLNFKTYARFKYLARRLAVVTKKVDWPGLIKTVDLPTLIGSRLPESYFEKLRKAG